MSWIGAAAAAFLATSAAYADTYTYKYVGPSFAGGTDHIEISFTTSAPLAVSKSYLTPAEASVISGTVNVVGPSGNVAGFPIPLFNLEIHTNATANKTVPGIDSWFIVGDLSSLTGVAPAQTGAFYQAYTMNTLAFIPGSDVPGAVGLVTGAYDYDQATETNYYASCSGVPGCTLAGNGQPYAGNYSGIINPSHTTAANWTLNVNPTQPPVSTPLTIAGALPDGVVNTSYSASLTATGGAVPYSWTATGLPAGLTIDSHTGAVRGTPIKVGSFGTTITVKDSKSQITVATPVIVIKSQTSNSYACYAPSGAKSFEYEGSITRVGNGYIVVGATLVMTPTCAEVLWNGASGFAVGQTASFEGYALSGGANVATEIAVNTSAPAR
ncbi:MAG: Ig domain-containing protein [Methylocella sp.]